MKRPFFRLPAPWRKPGAGSHPRIAFAFGLAAVAAAGVLFAAQSRPRATVLTFGMMAGSYWDVPNGDCYRIVDETIRRFETAHPGVKVRYESGVMKRDYSEWLSEQALLGQVPDVFMVQPEDFNTFAADGMLGRLSGLIAGDGNFHAADYYPASYHAGQYEGVQYALPYESVPVLMFVNKTMLRHNGVPIPSENWTWDDFYRICKQVTKDTNGDGRIDQFGFYDYTWEDAAYSNNATLFNAAGTACFIDDARVAAAVKFVKSLSATYGSTAPDSVAFDLGRVAFRPFLFSDYRVYRPYPWNIKKYSGFDWDCIRMPAGPSGENTSMLNTLLMGVSSRTGHKTLAWEFLKMLTYDETTQQDIFRYSQGVSVLRSVTESAETLRLLNQDTPNSQVINTTTLGEVMRGAATVPKFRKYDDVLQLANSRIGQIVSNDEDIQSSLLTLKRDILNELAQ